MTRPSYLYQFWRWANRTWQVVGSNPIIGPTGDIVRNSRGDLFLDARLRIYVRVQPSWF